MDHINQGKNTKDPNFLNFASKVFSLPQRSVIFKPFPNDIEHILLYYIRFCYYICVFPYKITLVKDKRNYVASSSIVQKVCYTIVWSLNLFQFFVVFGDCARSTKQGNSIDVLLLLGGLGHFFNISTYFFTVLYFKHHLEDLFNLFLTCTSSSSSDSTRDGNPRVIPMSFTKILQNVSLSLPNPEKPTKFFNFRTISILAWLFFLVAAIKCTGIMDAYFENGISEFIYFERSSLFKALNTTIPGFWTPTAHVPSSVMRNLAKIILSTATFYEQFASVFIYGLQITVALTVKCISSNFVEVIASSQCSADYWKPSSTTIVESFLMVRQAYRRLNRIFGWLMFCTLMGEFPNLTFCVVFSYKFPEANLQMLFKVLMITIVGVLGLSSSAVDDLSKLKEWFYSEGPQNWALVSHGSFQRRIVLHELTLNCHALYAHGFFQLSLPALVSIIGGILSNSLIIIQLDLSS